MNSVDNKNNQNLIMANKTLSDDACEMAISVENVTFSYGKEKSEVVLKNLSLSIKKGEYLCILGRNGSGKSTLSRLINGLLIPTEGQVKVFNMSTADKDNLFKIRNRVGMVFQNPDNQMVATMVEDDIAFGPENIGLPRQEIGERIDFALKSTGMEKFRFSQGQKLSGGQKQRIAIAGVLAVKPDILILDESTSMLDSKGRKEVLDVVKNLNESGITVISITHYMEEAVNASRVIVLDGGQIAIDGTPSLVFSNLNVLLNYGLDLPRAGKICQKLIEKGVPISSGILTPNELKEELCKLFQKA